MMLFDAEVKTGATFSPCRTWRYALYRTWNEEGGHLMFIGLNPSTADETQDDPTVRRCIGFAKREGYGGIFMLNLFAYRSTDPAALKVVDDPIGPENNLFLLSYFGRAKRAIAAWGVHGVLHGRDLEVAELLPMLGCLGTTKDGHPKHPLYLPSGAELRRFKVRQP